MDRVLFLRIKVRVFFLVRRTQGPMLKNQMLQLSITAKTLTQFRYTFALYIKHPVEVRSNMQPQFVAPAVAINSI